MTVVQLVQTPQEEDTRKAFEAAESHFAHVPNLVRALGTNPPMCLAVTEFFIQSLQDGRVSWKFKELVILKTLRAVGCHYSYGAHEALALELGNSADAIGDLYNSLWRDSKHFSDGEKAVFELVEQIAIDANNVSDENWDRLRAHWKNDQLVELDALITTFIMIGKTADTLGVAEPVMFKKKVA